MNKLLLRSLQVTHETTNTTLDEIAAQANMDKSELESISTELGNPISEWVKVTNVPDIVTPTQTDITPPSMEAKDKDTQLKEDIADAYRIIVKEAREFLAATPDMEPKDLKDMAAVIKLVEDQKFPRSSHMAAEFDLKQGVVRFLASTTDDV